MENDHIVLILEQLLKNDIQFCHSDQKITKLICNYCGEWIWDDEPASDINHKENCPILQAKEILRKYRKSNNDRTRT